MKQISIFGLGAMMAFTSVPAPAQDLTAGKTPAQLFSSDCAECHHSPSGLTRNRDVRMLASFLREHYTTKSDTASALAAYVSGFSGGGVAARNRGTGVGVPANSGSERRPVDRRRRNDGDAAAATGDDAGTNARPLEDPAPAVRRRRATSANGLSGEGEKRRNRGDSDVPRPPGNIVPTPTPQRSNAPARDSAPRDAVDPISRLRSYLSSGLGFEDTIAEAAKMGVPKGHKRRNRVDDVEPIAPGVQATAKTTVDAPLPATSDAIAREAQPEGNASPPSVPPAPPDVTSPRTEQ